MFSLEVLNLVRSQSFGSEEEMPSDRAYKRCLGESQCGKIKYCSSIFTVTTSRLNASHCGYLKDDSFIYREHGAFLLFNMVFKMDLFQNDTMCFKRTLRSEIILTLTIYYTCLTRLQSAFNNQQIYTIAVIWLYSFCIGVFQEY